MVLRIFLLNWFLAGVFVFNPAFAQDWSHDHPRNDPSDPKKAITLNSPIAQKDFAVQGTLKQLRKNARKSLSTLLNPIPLLNQVMNPPLSYEEILSQKPSLFQGFKINEARRFPEKANGPTTVNADHEYAGISDREFGFCWGYATFVRFFTQVAFYDPSLPRPALKTTLAQVDQVIRGEAAVFEGYSHFRDLTLVPEIEFYLKLAAMELWRARAVKFNSIGITLNSTDWMKFDEVESLLVDLEKRLARGEFPKVIFASLIPTKPFYGMNTDIHVVPAYQVKRLSKNRARIYLWDINYYSETLKKAPKYLDIDSNHGITYAPYVEPNKPYARGSDMIGRVILAPENDVETAAMLNSLDQFCSNQKTKKYCRSRK